jgi:hypothetical protein
MYCPSCGIQSSPDQKFCRSCGMDLQAVSQLVVGKLSPSNSESLSYGSEKTVQHRMVKILGWGGVILFMGLVLSVIGRKYLHNELLDAIGWIMVLLAFFITGYGLFSAWLSGTKTSQRSLIVKANTQRDLPDGEMLEMFSEEAPSITEHTTRLIEGSEQRNSKHQGVVK